MTCKKDPSRAPRRLGRLSIWAGFAILLLSILERAADNIEALVTPVVSLSSMEDVKRDADRVCWTWVFMKHRDVAPIAMNFNIRADRFGAIYPQVVNGITGKPLIGSRTNKPGLLPFRQRFCFEVPDGIENSDPITVSGQAVYPSAQGWWRIYHEIPCPTKLTL